MFQLHHIYPESTSHDHTNKTHTLNRCRRLQLSLQIFRHLTLLVHIRRRVLRLPQLLYRHRTSSAQEQPPTRRILERAQEHVVLEEELDVLQRVARGLREATPRPNGHDNTHEAEDEEGPCDEI